MNEPVSAGTDPAALPPRPHSRIRRIIVIALLAVLACILAAAGYIWYRTTHSTVSSVTINPQSAFDKGDLKGAMEQVDGILALDPDNVNALVQKSLATAQAALASPDRVRVAGEAASLARQAIDASGGKSSEAYRALGFAHSVEGKYADAHAAYEKSLGIDPHNALSLAGDADIYAFEGETAKAKAGYEAALAADSTTYQADMGLGHIIALGGDTDGAIAEFTKAYNYSPNQNLRAQAAFSIGLILIDTGNVDLARAYMEKATQFDPNYPQAWFGTGTAYYAQSVKAAADPSLRPQAGALMLASIRDLKRATLIDPTLVLAHLQLAIDYDAANQDAEARTSLERAKTLLPADTTLSAADRAALSARIEAFAKTLK